MLTSFFRKSKPINFLIVGLLAALFYVLFNFGGDQNPNGWLDVLEKLGLLLVFLAQAFLISFTLKKDKSEARHTFGLYLFILLCIAFPNSLQSPNLIWVGFFTIMGLRRTYAIQTGEAVPQKIFDAVFCVVLASFFYPPVLLLVLVPLIGILVYEIQNYKNWIIPIFAVLAAFILKTTLSLLLYDTFFNPFSFYTLAKPEFGTFENAQIFWPLLLLVLLAIWAFANLFTEKAKTTIKEKKLHYMLLITFLIALGIILFPTISAKTPGAQLLLLIVPTALASGKYFEKNTHRHLKEIILLALSVICLFLGIVIRWGLL